MQNNHFNSFTCHILFLNPLMNLVVQIIPHIRQHKKRRAGNTKRKRKEQYI